MNPFQNTNIQIASIELTNGGNTLVDLVDFERFNKYHWQKSPQGYAYRSASVKGKAKVYLLHREILNTPKGMQTDHVNRNRLDNRKENLRICTNQENQGNSKRNRTKSLYKGVAKQSLANSWQARIWKNYKPIYLGTYKTPEEAAKAYDLKAKELQGKFAQLNFN